MMLNELEGTTIQYRPVLRADELRDRQLDTITHIVLHETGVGIYRRAQQLKTTNGLELALHVYEKIMPFSGHYLIGPTGTPVQTASLAKEAQHVGARGSRHYERLDNDVSHLPLWWRTRSAKHPHMVPSMLSAWKGGSVNNISAGIEIVPPPRGGEELPGVQVQSVAYMIDLLCKKLLNVCYITTHTLVHPISRTTLSGKPYDMRMDRYQQIVDALPPGLKRRCV